MAKSTEKSAKKSLTFLLLQLFLLSFSLHLQAQEELDRKQIPQAVLTTFTTQFKNISGEEWYFENNQYNVFFQFDNRSYSLQLSPSGEILRTVKTIAVSELPEVVKNKISEYENSNWEINGLRMIESKSETLYQISFVKEDDIKSLTINKEGKILNTQ